MPMPAARAAPDPLDVECRTGPPCLARAPASAGKRHVPTASVLDALALRAAHSTPARARTVCSSASARRAGASCRPHGRRSQRLCVPARLDHEASLGELQVMGGGGVSPRRPGSPGSWHRGRGEWRTELPPSGRGVTVGMARRRRHCCVHHRDADHDAHAMRCRRRSRRPPTRRWPARRTARPTARRAESGLRCAQPPGGPSPCGAVASTSYRRSGTWRAAPPQEGVDPPKNVEAAPVRVPTAQRSQPRAAGAAMPGSRTW
jgi:hypothetical protein